MTLTEFNCGKLLGVSHSLALLPLFLFSLSLQVSLTPAWNFPSKHLVNGRAISWILKLAAVVAVDKSEPRMGMPLLTLWLSDASSVTWSHHFRWMVEPVILPVLWSSRAHFINKAESYSSSKFTGGGYVLGSCHDRLQCGLHQHIWTK